MSHYNDFPFSTMYSGCRRCTKYYTIMCEKYLKLFNEYLFVKYQEKNWNTAFVQSWCLIYTGLCNIYHVAPHILIGKCKLKLATFHTYIYAGPVRYITFGSQHQSIWWEFIRHMCWTCKYTSYNAACSRIQDCDQGTAPRTWRKNTSRTLLLARS